MKNKMKNKTMKRSLMLFLFVAAFAQIGNAQITATVDTGMTWVGYMNVFDSVGVNYMFGSPWAIPDIKTTVDPGNGSMRLHPNFSAYNATDPYWSNGAMGNKVMEANTFIEDTTIMGQTLTFQGMVDSFTLDTAYTAEAFIKVLDPNNSWATVLHTKSPITATGSFLVTDSVPNTPGLVTQYGFTILGLNANPTMEAALGNVLIRGNNAPPMPPVQVTFQVQASDSTPVYVFGSWTGFGNWPGDTMASIGNDTYERTLTIPGGQPIEYLFVHGNVPTKEVMDSTAACVLTTNGFTNRLANLGIMDTTICHRWETCSSCVPVGIDELTKDNISIMVSNKYVNLVTNTLTKVDGVEIYDLMGRTVYSSDGSIQTNKRINVDLNHNTVYIIRVNNGSQYHTIKTTIVQ